MPQISLAGCVLTVVLVALVASSAAAQPEPFSITPDTLFWSRDTGPETPYVLRNTGPDSFRLDSLAIGLCSHPYCGESGPAYFVRFEHGDAVYLGFLSGPEWTEWDPGLPRVTIAPGDSARLYVDGMDGCPVCLGGDPDFDTLAPVLFWGQGRPEPILRTLAFIYPLASEPEAAQPSFELLPAGSNPFRDETALLLRLTVPAEVEVALFDGLGRRAATLVKGRREAGSHALAVRSDGLAPGLYFVRAAIRTGQGATVLTRRLIHLR